MLVRSITSLALACLVLGSICTVTGQIPDPLAETFSRELRPAVDALISEFRGQRKYRAADFPLPADRFGQFRQEVVSELVQSLHLEEWVVRSPGDKRSPIGHLYRDRVV